MKKYFSFILDAYRNLKFVRKIQGGFLALAFISTIIAFSSYYFLQQMGNVKDELFENYIKPRKEIEDLYANFLQIQFIMMKFSMQNFSGSFQQDYAKLEKFKKEADESLTRLKEINLDEKTNKDIQDIGEIWNEYKMIVVDGIVSASVTQSYEMAADISVSSGEEVGNRLLAKFNSILSELNKRSDEVDQSSKATIGLSILLTVIGMILGTIIFILCVFILAPMITKPINKLKIVVSEFALGDYDVVIDNNSNDEIGELAELLKTLQKNQKDKVYAAESIAAGNFAKVELASEKDSLAIAFNSEVHTIEKLIQEAGLLIEASRNGKLDYRGDDSKFEGSWGELIRGMNNMVDAAVDPVREASKILAVMAEKDFSSKMEGAYKGDHQLMKNNINLVVESLKAALTQVAESAAAVASSSSQISSSSEEMAAGAQEQSQQTTEIASSVEEMTKIILESAKNVNIASETTKKASDSAKHGAEKIEETKKGINRIVVSAQETANIITSLAKKTEQIGEITQVIDDIADQTNLLALNAAIEAARAGEQGRGFAVVADEVRKLAERTTKATKEIADTIKAIQKEAKNADDSMVTATHAVQEGMDLTNEVAVVLNEILTGSEKVSSIVTQVALASEQQATAAEEISKNIEGISSVTQQTSSGIQQIARAAEDLNRLTVNLQELVTQFNTGANGRSNGSWHAQSSEKILYKTN